MTAIAQLTVEGSDITTVADTLHDTNRWFVYEVTGNHDVIVIVKFTGIYIIND